MRLRWAAAAALETERNFRRIIGHEDLWILQAALGEAQATSKKPKSVLDGERLAA
jgi:hypothetical protein